MEDRSVSFLNYEKRPIIRTMTETTRRAVLSKQKKRSEERSCSCE